MPTDDKLYTFLEAFTFVGNALLVVGVTSVILALPLSGMSLFIYGPAMLLVGLLLKGAGGLARFWSTHASNSAPPS
jgi:hypothetical protein